jgi:HAE1 family hydrophobic/amphiphilic exporter-1
LLVVGLAAPAAAALAGTRRASRAPQGTEQNAPAPPASAVTQAEEVAPLARPTPEADLTAAGALIQFQDVPDTRVGVDNSNVVRLTLHDAILMGLQHNLDIKASSFDLQLSDYDLKAAKGAYDLFVTADFTFRSANTPVTSIFAGGGLDATINTKSISFGAAASQLFKSGGSASVSFDTVRQQTDATVSTLNPQYQPQLSFDFTQPLMRNLSIDATRRQIHIARKQKDVSDSVFRQRVIEIVSQIQRAYWDLVFSQWNERIQREAVNLSKVQLDNNIKRVQAGTLAPIELRSTESQLESSKERVISAMQAISLAENTLKALLLDNPADPTWMARIVPVDQANLAPITMDLQSATDAALLNRPELEQLKLQSQLKAIDLKYYKNQLKPQLDFVTNYTLTGLAGEPVQITGAVVPDQFIGGYGRALGTLFSNDFPTWSAGVKFSFPVQNRTAEANLGRTRAEIDQLEIQQRRLVQSIQVEVRNALQAVEAARQRFEAARASRVAAEAQLRGEEVRYQAGLSTNFFVLERQNALSEARGSEAQALTDYNKALVDLQRVTGTTISSNNVSIAEPQD